jgi:16S rRNA (adenine1518-N6/adenine1519-N6)-dimethyltransferase
LNLTRRIARAAGNLSAGTTIEIGPGPGGLTRSLLAAGAGELIVVERDRRCLPALDQIVESCPGRLKIVEGDALDIAVHTLGRPPRRIVANLPYNIATLLLLRWLAHADAFEAFTLMFQKEVAHRLVARPRTPAYGRLAVATQWRADVRLLFDVDPRAFTPSPKVVSTVVQISPRATPLAPADPGALERVAAAGFGQRRKMLRASLRSLGVDSETLLARAGIAPTARAEELSIGEFCALARAYAAVAG